MTSVERRWQVALFAAIIPGAEGGRLPGLNAIALDTFWPRFQQAAPLLVRFGFRFSIIALSLLPLLTHGRAFPRLNRDQQDAYLHSLITSRWYALRQLVTVVKLIACFAYFNDSEVQATLRAPR